MESGVFQGRSDDLIPEPKITVAAPVYNEESIVPDLLRRTRNVLNGIPGGPHEIVLVDDGSSDGTLALLEQATLSDPNMVVIALSRNFGHQAALSAALDHASGDVVVVIDGDLQDPPEAIPQLLAKYREGYDVVYAIRTKRKEWFVLQWCYFLFYRLITSLAEISLPLDAGDCGLMSRRVVDLIRSSPERQRYLRGLRSWYGFRQIGIEIERESRHSGHSKYSLRKLLRLAFDGLFAFSVVPLRLAILVGLLAIACSVGFAAYSLVAKLLFEDAANQSPRGFTALIIAITFLAGVQLLFLGIIGEYTGRIYDEVKRRPHYVAKKVTKGPPHGP